MIQEIEGTSMILWWNITSFHRQVVEFAQSHSDERGIKTSHWYTKIGQRMDSIYLHFVSSRERPWRHWESSRIHATRRILYASIPCSFFNAREDAKVARAMTLTSVFLWNARWRHGLIRDETKYSLPYLELGDIGEHFTHQLYDNADTCTCSCTQVKWGSSEYSRI